MISMPSRLFNTLGVMCLGTGLWLNNDGVPWRGCCMAALTMLQEGAKVMDRRELEERRHGHGGYL